VVRRMRVKAHQTKRVIRRSMFEHVQGTTVRFVEPEALPTGCCHLISSGDSSMPYPCTRTMTHVELLVEDRFVPQERGHVPVVKMLGYCKTHRPKRVEAGLVYLPSFIIKQVNGTSKTKAKMRRMTNALFVDVAAPGSSTIHAVSRTEFSTITPDANWGENADTLCGKNLKEAVVVTDKNRREDTWKDCPVCAEKKTVADDE